MNIDTTYYIPEVLIPKLIAVVEAVEAVEAPRVRPINQQHNKLIHIHKKHLYISFIIKCEFSRPHYMVLQLKQEVWGKHMTGLVLLLRH